MSEINSGMRVFVDSNVLISAMQSEKSVSRELLFLVSEEHRLIICGYSLVEVARVLAKRFPHQLSDLYIIPHITIRDDKDLPILVSALLAQPDIFIITGDQDFHTPEIKERFVV